MKKILLTMCIALCLPVMCMAKERLVLIGDASLAPHSIANPDVRGWGEKLSALFTDKVPNTPDSAAISQIPHLLNI